MFEEYAMLAFSDSEVAVIAVISGGILVLAVALSYQWRRVRVAAYNAKLKQLMIERGMTADEIEQVLRAESSPKHLHH